MCVILLAWMGPVLAITTVLVVKGSEVNSVNMKVCLRWLFDSTNFWQFRVKTKSDNTYTSWELMKIYLLHYRPARCSSKTYHFRQDSLVTGYRKLDMTKNWVTVVLVVTCSPVYMECEDNICENGAGCKLLARSYICVCQPGYVGAFCERKGK